MRARQLGAAAGLAVAGAAMAQPTTTSSIVSFDLTWTEADSTGHPVASPNGVLDPGESALFQIGVSFTNQYTIGTWTPAMPPPGSGTIMGFATGFVDLNGTGNALGTWNVSHAAGFGTAAAWDLVGPNGWGTSANGGATLLGVQMGQFPTSPDQIVTTNPIPEIWKGLWTPLSYDARDVSFSLATSIWASGPAGWVLFRATASTSAAAGTVQSITGSTGIQTFPAPAGLLVLGAAGWGRRRR